MYEKGSTLFRRIKNLASFLPTHKATWQHAFHVYHQVRRWLANHLLEGIAEWYPVTTTQAASEELLKIMGSKCTRCCSGNCNCHKVELHLFFVNLGERERKREINLEENIDEVVHNFLLERIELGYSILVKIVRTWTVFCDIFVKDSKETYTQFYKQWDLVGIGGLFFASFLF